MKRIILLVCLISISTAFSSVDNSKLQKRLECNVDAFGMKSLTVFEDESDLIGWMKIDIKYTNGTMESKGISANDFSNLENQELYITTDGELNTTLKKVNDKYILNSRGDGYNQSKELSCEN
jgi:hypothetical protein